MRGTVCCCCVCCLIRHRERRRFFGLRGVAATALDAVLAFTPGVPNWAYNGASLGICDFSNNAKITPYGGWERVLQHYRAGALRSLSPSPLPSPHQLLNDNCGLPACPTAAPCNAPTTESLCSAAQ